MTWSEFGSVVTANSVSWYRHKHGGRCRFSNAANNYCLQAHSSEELAEWNERYEWRVMKKDVAKSQHLYSYMEQLLDDYNRSSPNNSTSVVSTASLRYFDSNAFSRLRRFRPILWTEIQTT